MNKTMRQIDSLKFDPNNARKHDERNIKAIMDSLSAVGQRKPIVIYSDMVVAGNGTLQAAKRLGWTEIWVNDDPFESLDAAKAYAIGDNQTGLLATWDEIRLGDTLTELKDAGWDLETVGFKDHEYDLILNGGFVPDLPDDDDKISEQKITLVVTFKDQDSQQDLFDELKERGFKVKA